MIYKKLIEKSQQNEPQVQDTNIELCNFSQSRFSEVNCQIMYDGKFSLDLENENKKKVLKYICVLIVLIITFIFLVSYSTNLSDEEEEDKNGNKFEEIKIDETARRQIHEEIEIRYHQGCVKDTEQENRCVKCIYNSNIEQASMEICDTCCKTCLQGYVYLTQRYCIREEIKIFVQFTATTIESNSILHHQLIQNTTLYHIIQILQQSQDWKDIKIKLNYGQIFISQINFLKEALFYLTKTINSLEKLESLEIESGYISVKDDIYGKNYKYDNSFIYEDVFNGISLTTLKDISIDLQQIAISSDSVVLSFLSLAQRQTCLNRISVSMNQYTQLTNETIHQLHAAIANNINITDIHLSLPIAYNSLQHEVYLLLDTISSLNQLTQLTYSQQFDNEQLSNIVVDNISKMACLNLLNLQIYPVSVSNIANMLKQLKQLQYLQLTLTQIATLDVSIFSVLQQSTNTLVEFQLQLVNTAHTLLLDDITLIYIGQMLESQNNITTLYLHFDCTDSFTDQGLEKMLQSISKVLPTLTHFHLSTKSQQLSENALQLIAKYFENSDKLQQFYLDMSQNINFTKQGLISLSENLQRIRSLTHIHIDIKSSNKIRGENDEYNFKLITNLVSPPKLISLHVIIHETSKRQILKLLDVIQSTNIIDLQLLTNTLYQHPQENLIITEFRELKYLQKFIRINFEVEDKSTYEISEDICCYMLKPFQQQKSLQDYKVSIGCEQTVNEFQYYINIVSNMYDQATVIINRDEYNNMTDIQIQSLFAKEKYLSNVKSLQLDLKNQQNLSQSAIIQLIHYLSPTITYYSLTLPSNIDFSSDFLQTISHYNAMMYSISRYTLDITHLNYTLADLQIFIHSLLISSKRYQTNISITLPCQLQSEDIYSLGTYFQLFQTYYLELNECKFLLTQDQIQQIEESFQSTYLNYYNNKFIIKKLF